MSCLRSWFIHPVVAIRLAALASLWLAACGDGGDGPVNSVQDALNLRPELKPVGYWNFDTQSAPAVDSSGKSPSAQLTKTTWTASGRAGGALYFNGTDAIATVPDGGWNTGNPATYNLWFKSEGAPAGYLLGHEFNTTNAGAFALDAAGAKFRSYDSTRKVRDQPFGSLPAQTWTMLTIVINTNSIRLYKNATLVGSTTRNLVKRAGPLHIGARGPNASPYRGWIDEVAVFGRGLSDAEISEVYALYNQPPPPVGGSGGEGSLLGRWTFDDGTASDVSGNHNDGQISGAVPADDGRFGNALYFDGKSYVLVPDGNWNRDAPFTYNVWFKPEGEAEGFVFDHHVGWQSPGAFALRNEGEKKGLTFMAFDGSGAEVSYTGEAVPADTWTMFTTVITQTEVRMYMNGTLWKRLDKLGLPRSEGDLYLGASDNAKWGFFKGWIDEVSIYGRALTDAEVGTLTGDPICCGTVPGSDVARPGPAETFPEIASQTAAVVEGTVRTIDYAFTDRQGPYTVVTLGDVTAHMGSAPSAITIRQFGGPLPNGRGLRVSHQTMFVKGKRYIVFLRNTSWNFSPVVALNAFRVETVEGRELLVSHDGSAVRGVDQKGIQLTYPIFEPPNRFGDPPALRDVTKVDIHRATEPVRQTMPATEMEIEAIAGGQSPEEERRASLSVALNRADFLRELTSAVTISELRIQGRFYDRPAADFDWRAVPGKRAPSEAPQAAP